MLKFPMITVLALFSMGPLGLTGLGAQGPTRFVENKGQWQADVRYRRKIGPATAWFLDRSLVFGLVRESQSKTVGAKAGVEGLSLAIHFEGARSSSAPEGDQELPGHENFFLGQDRSRWASHVRGFARLLYRDLYPGISFSFRESEHARGIVEYDLLLKPGADLSRVVMRCEGIEGLSVDKEGSLLMKTQYGTIRQAAPKTWQELPDGGRKLVTCRYRLLDGLRYGFEVEGWDKDLPLTIDPDLVYGSFWGAGGNDAVLDMFVDKLGRVILVGRTSSTDFPVSKGAWSEKNKYKPTKLWHGFVSCFTPDYKTLVFSTYLGGSEPDELDSVFSNANQEILVGGSSFSMDYPVSKNALQAKRAGTSVFVPYNSDFVLTKLSKDGSSLLYSTYLGGLGLEEASDVHLSDAGIASLVGSAERGFPTTPGAYQRTSPSRLGEAQPLALRLDTVKSSLVFATYIGGSRYGHARALHVDAKGLFDLVGETRSQDFPTTIGAFKTRSMSKNGDDKLEGFFARLSATGARLLLSTRLGGSGRDSVAGLIHEQSGSLLLYGWTASKDLPAHKGAYRETYAGNGTGAVSYRGDGFVLRLDAKASKVLACTYLGGSEDDEIRVGAVDDWGQLWVAGATGSADLPSSKGSFKEKYETPGFQTWNGEVFFARLDDRLERLIHLSYYGGSGIEEVRSLWVDSASREIVFAGITRSAVIPVSLNAYQPRKWGSYAGFLTRIRPTSSAERYSRKASPCESSIFMEPMGPPVEKRKDFDVQVLGAPKNSSGFMFLSFKILTNPLVLPAPWGVQWHFQLAAPNLIFTYPIKSDAKGLARIRLDLTLFKKSMINDFYLHAIFAQKAGLCSKNKNYLSSTRLLQVDLQSAIAK